MKRVTQSDPFKQVEKPIEKKTKPVSKKKTKPIIEDEK